MKKSYIVHPFLFALFHILFLFAHNVEEISFSEILLPSAVVLGITLLLVFLIRSIIKDGKKVAIIISVFIVLFFSYGRIYDLIMDQYIGSLEIGRHRYLLFCWGLLLTYSAYLIIKTRRDLYNLTRTLNVSALTLVFISLVNIGVYELKIKNIWQDTSKPMECLENRRTDLENVSEFRDIYYIILDGYASSRTLKDVYDFDNQNFNDYLITKDFYVATKSQANYPRTFLSLASSLNLEYINYLPDVIGRESANKVILNQMIRDNKVMNFLKLKGYKFIHFSSGWGSTDRNIYADLNIHSGKFNEFILVLIQTTMLKLFAGPIIVDLRKARLLTFSKLAKVHRIKGPKFVFAHVLSPHSPYLFGANGELVPNAELKIGGNQWKQKEHYLNQLIFINKKVEELVNELLLNSEIPPIIIVQADHGPASTYPESLFHVVRPTKNMLRERMGILNAYYLPSGGRDLLYESITPVNTFRLIFDFYFNTNCGLLDDQSYYSNYAYTYEFINVTDSVKYY